MLETNKPVPWKIINRGLHLRTFNSKSEVSWKFVFGTAVDKLWSVGLCMSLTLGEQSPKTSGGRGLVIWRLYGPVDQQRENSLAWRDLKWRFVCRLYGKE